MTKTPETLNILNPDFRMPEHCGGDRWSILHGDSLQIIREFEPNSFDAIITDPPYASGGSIQEQTAAEEKRLETAKAATAKFIEAARAICNTQLKNIDSVASGILPQAAEAEPAVSVDDTVRSIENSASPRYSGIRLSI